MRVIEINSWLRRGAISGCFLATAVIPAVGHAQIYSDREIALLPEYCKYAQAGPLSHDLAQVAKWKEILGPTYTHIHHYCYGLADINFAKLFAKDAQQRIHRYGTAVGQIQYVLDRAPADFVLLPEMHTRKGESLVALGKGGLGVAEFQRAIELKRDYWPPYADLSDYYKSIGEVQMARGWLEKGLAIIPGAEALRRRVVELDKTHARPSVAPKGAK